MIGAQATAARRRLVIVVDDDRDTRDMLRMALELEGYDVQLASNGLRLISTLHAQPPDLILLDVMMSWIDGYDLCRKLRQETAFEATPVIMISGRKHESDIKEGLSAGATDYFGKPLDMDRLLGRVRDLIG